MASARAFSAIIISYNSGSLLPSCLHSIFRAMDGLEGQVIVFDNGSPQPLPESLKSDYPQVEWMHSDKNLGFGTACNRAAQKAKHPYFFFVNPDTLVSKDTFASLLNYISDKPDAGVVGCRILNGDGSLQWACRRSFPSPMAAVYKTLGLASLFPKSRTFGAYNLTYLDPEHEEIVDAVSGSFFCVRREVYESIGGFDEDFFLYGEDLDICYRIQQAGRKNFYFPGTSIIHFKGQSSKTRMVRSYIDFYQAMIIFARKHPTFLQPVPLWMISVGVFCAAALGVFSRLLPDWTKMLTDVAWLTLLWLGLDQVGVSVEPMGFAFWVGGTVLPLLFLGEYGAYQLSPKDLGSRVAPFLFLSIASAIAFFHQTPWLFAGALVGLMGIWFWRRLLFWFHYFRGVFTGQRKRSVLLGNHASVSDWFIRENLLPGRDVLGCVSAQGAGDAQEHYLGPVRDILGIRMRTGVMELLVVPDRSGQHEEIPSELLGLRGKIRTWLLIGHPDTSTFAMVDLHFLK